MVILGIESSCDETAAAIVENGHILHAHEVISQIDVHREFGGVVPEVAARSHVEVITPVIQRALTSADMDWGDIDAIAVTQGPGLSGSLLIGTLAARILAWTQQKPLYGLHHVIGHVYANFITTVSDQYKTELPTADQASSPKFQIMNSLPKSGPEFPILALIVSGGHSQLALFRDHDDYTLLGQTRDDAVGEAFDKVAKIIGLPYPGGPSISQRALQGDDSAYTLPISRLENPYDFSFSGLKTAALRLAQTVIGEDYTFPSYEIAPRLSEQQVSDMAASFEKTAVETLVKATVAAEEEFRPQSVVIAGGVAANRRLRADLKSAIPNQTISYAPPQLCTDNASMMAALGFFSAQHHQASDHMTMDVRPSWSM